MLPRSANDQCLRTLYHVLNIPTGTAAGDRHYGLALRIDRPGYFTVTGTNNRQPRDQNGQNHNDDRKRPTDFLDPHEITLPTSSKFESGLVGTVEPDNALDAIVARRMVSAMLGIYYAIVTPDLPPGNVPQAKPMAEPMNGNCSDSLGPIETHQNHIKRGGRKLV